MKKVWWLLFLLPSVVLAAPNVTNLTLNSRADNATLNINDDSDEVEITLSASENVKWSTIAICAVSDTVCSRTTAVKYFTQTSSFTNQVTKLWDGKRSNGEVVTAGSYKIKVTVKNESEEESIQTFSSPLIEVIEGEEITAKATSPAEEEEEGGSADDVDYSAHSEQTSVSTKSARSSWQIDVGRPRTILTGGLLELAVSIASGNGEGAKYRWSFGDGTWAHGEKAAHRYRLPGSYEIVVTGARGETKAVARTRVTVLRPSFNLEWSKEFPNVLEIINTSANEVNLGDFTLSEGEEVKFVFPLDTIISPKGVLMLDPLVSGLTAEENLELKTPVGQPVGGVLSIADQQKVKLQELTLALREAEMKLAALKPLEILTASPTKAGQREMAVSSAPISPPVVTLNNQPSNWWQYWLARFNLR